MDEPRPLPDPLAALPSPNHQVVPRGRRRTEPELRDAVAAWLTAHYVALAERIVCLAGEPDIVSADRRLIVEVKYQLTRKALFQALGQALLYREAINPSARVVVIGYCTPETLALTPLIGQLGVQVLCWDDRDLEAGRRGDEGERRSAEAEAEMSVLLADDGGQSDGVTLSTLTEISAPTVEPDGHEVPGERQGVTDETVDVLVPAAMDGRNAGGEPYSVTDDTMVDVLAPAGDDGEIERQGATSDTMTNSPTVSALPVPPSSFLSWRLAELARSQGFPNASQLATRLHMDRQSLYPIWNGAARQISLAMLSQLAQALGAEPGDWFRWGLGDGDQGLATSAQPPAPDAQSLHWNVAAQAQARGLDLSQLSFRAEVHMTSMRPIWQGRQQAVTLMVLGRIALALDTPERPFGIGDLFAWGVENTEG